MMKKKKYAGRIRLFLIWITLILAAGCGGGGGDGTGTKGDPSSVATSVKSSEPTADCPNGGVTVYSGIDSNGNGTLDDSEIRSGQEVCNGADGSAGSTALVAIVDEPSGTNCAGGGKKISVGMDSDGDGALDADEITSHDYICDGEDGNDGTNGHNSLVSIDPAAPSRECNNGGINVQSGLDVNDNGVLDSGEVSSSRLVCNGDTGDTGPEGPQGPGITWETMNGSFTAEANKGYLVDGDVLVTAGLPDSASLVPGDIIEIDGIGSGGWKIGQQDGQMIVTKNIENPVFGLTARAADRAWNSIASSADGSRLVAVAAGGQIYTSADFGASWTARDSVRNWHAVASSSDGRRLVAIVLNGQIYTSVDFGVTWVARDSARLWHAVASSADGSKLVAVVDGGRIYTSANYGVNWTPRDSDRIWWSVASSADGVKLVAGVDGGRIYTSDDSGVTWTPRDSDRTWRSVASSADGTRLVAGVYSGQIFISTDSGVAWFPYESARYWSSVASSADGRNLIAGAAAGHIYTSADSGLTWAPRDANRAWISVAMSSDGAKFAAAVSQGQIYTANRRTTSLGVDGYVSGNQYDFISLQYIGGGLFNIIGYLGILTIN